MEGYKDRQGGRTDGEAAKGGDVDEKKMGIAVKWMERKSGEKASVP